MEGANVDGEVYVMLADYTTQVYLETMLCVLTHRIYSCRAFDASKTIPSYPDTNSTLTQAGTKILAKTLVKK